MGGVSTLRSTLPRFRKSLLLESKFDSHSSPILGVLTFSILCLPLLRAQSRMRMLSSLVTATALFFATASQAAVIVSENFETSSPPALPPGWTSQASGTITGSAVTEATGGNPGKDLLLTVDSSAATGFWRFEAIYTFAGPLPTSDLSQLLLTADLKGNEAGAQYVFNVWSYKSNGTTVSGKADFTGLTTTSFAPIGGLLSQTTPAATLDTQAEIFKIRIWLEGRSTSFGFDENNWLRFDNLVFAQVPEPSTYALAAMGMIGLVAFRRQTKLTPA
jgi:hypothetical protein